MSDTASIGTTRPARYAPGAGPADAAKRRAAMARADRSSAAEDADRWRTLTLAFVALGAALRVWQYAANTSFWLDEISIARNVVARQPLGTLLFRPLAFEQVAPKGFLLAEWLGVRALGPTEYGLRLFPLCCGLAALALFWRLAERALDRRGAAFAVALFAFAIPLVRYSAEAKQYGADVAATLALSLIAIDLAAREPSVRRCVAHGAAGAVLAYFSQAAVLVMAALGALLVARWLVRRAPSTRRPALVTVPIWAAAAFAALVAARHSMTPETQAFMYDFWRDGFPPRPFTAASAAGWLAGRPGEIVAHGAMLRYPAAPLYVALALAGFVALGRRDRWLALVVGAPVAVTLAAAVVRQYPFDRRLVLFLLPAVLLALAAAVEWIADALSRWRVPAALTAAALLLGPAYAFGTTRPPYRTEEYKPVLRYVQQHRQPGDAVLVFRGAGAAAAFYGPRFGLVPGAYVLGGCDPDSLRVFLRDVDRFRGAPRLWVIEASVRSYVPARRAMDGYLAAIGTRREGITVPAPIVASPVSATLYDLSDPARLAAAASDRYPLPPPADSTRAVCRSFMLPSPLDR